MGDQSNFQCRSCGAQLNESAKKGKIICPYCGTVNVFKQQIEMEGMLICPNCGAANHKEAEYCEDCGQSLYLACPKCGTRNKADRAHCTKCGQELAEETKLRGLYFDYLVEAKRIKRTFQSRMGPWYLSLIPTLFAIIMNIIYRGPFVTVIGTLFIFSIPAMILLPIGKNSVKKKNMLEIKEVESTDFTRMGFTEFYKLYSSKHYWSDAMVQGEKRERFLSIVKMN